MLRPSDLGDLSQDLNDCTTSGGSFSTVFELGDDASGETELMRAEVTKDHRRLLYIREFLRRELPTVGLLASRSPGQEAIALLG